MRDNFVTVDIEQEGLHANKLLGSNQKQTTPTETGLQRTKENSSSKKAFSGYSGLNQQLNKRW